MRVDDEILKKEFYRILLKKGFDEQDAADAAKIFAALKEKHIFVRYFPKPRINQYLRITIGTDEQMDALFKALEEIV